MKIVKISRLYFREGKSDKVYEVDLCELPGAGDEKYLVNFRYGRRGGKLKEGTKTPSPVALAKAEHLFQSVVVSKLNKGYKDSEVADSGSAEASQPVPSSTDNSSTDKFDALRDALCSQLVEQADSAKRSRIIWRLAELRHIKAADLISSFIGKGDWLEDYSIAWALGRLGDKNQIIHLDRLISSASEQVCGIAVEAKLSLSGHSERQSLLQDTFEMIPEKIKSALNDGEASDVSAALAGEFASSAQNNTLLSQCYQLALIYPALHQALLSQLRTLSFIPGNFKGIRKIFKAAEFRLDAPVFGVLTQRIECSKSFFGGYFDWTYIPGVGGVYASKELKKTDAKLAYSNRTRDYLRRRTWRTLRKMGTASDPAYVDMATQVLLAMRDEYSQEPRHSDSYRWNSESGWERELVSSNVYGSFAGFLSFNHILFEHSDQYQLSGSGRAWLQMSAQPMDGRGEAFPHLWDQRPDACLTLLKESYCEPVHIFASAVLQDHQDFCAAISVADLEQLLASSYASTAQFAFDLIKSRLASGAVSQSLLLALLRSKLTEAREYGLNMLVSLDISSDDTVFLSSLLAVQHVDVQERVLAYVGAFDFRESEQVALLQAIVDSLEKNNTLNLSYIETLFSFVLDRLKSAVSVFPISEISRLLQSNHPGKKLTGAKLLLGHATQFQDIPELLLARIHEASEDQVRAIGAALIGKQPDEALIQQLNLLCQLLESSEREERLSILAILHRLSAIKSAWAEEVLQAVVPMVFRAEPSQGFHELLFAFIKNHLDMPLRMIDKGLHWRLINAQSVCAQQVGALALQYRDPKDYSVKQWSSLSCHADVSVRSYAFSAFNQHVDLIRQNLADALRLLESPWLDSREFGFRYFREHFKPSEWNPDSVLYLCDSVKDDVQIFGRELLLEFLNKEEGPAYLLKLSQHPSSNVQLFVSGILEEYASGNEEKILALAPYFTSVLSQVNKARVAKDRVIGFLLKEAMANQKVAAVVSELFTRISLTVVHKDKSALLQAMLMLKKSRPELILPIEVKTPVIKTKVVAGN